MKRQYKNLKGCLLFATCLLAMEAGAQGYSPAAIEQLKMQRLWFQSQNAAGTAFDDVQNYSNVILNYGKEDGNYCRPMDAQRLTKYGVSSEGFINLKSAYVWGAFNFSEVDKSEVGYNAGITDPYRGMPYYLVDSYISDWRNQNYELKFRAATPVIGNHWAFGIEGTYIATLSAKQRDPRVDARVYTLELMPGVTYKLNDNHKFGASFRYTSLKEEVNDATQFGQLAHDSYRLNGLGNAVYKHKTNAIDANYFGDRLGGALQYNFTTNVWNVLLEGAYSVKAESAEVTFTSPEKWGTVKDKLAEVTLIAVRQGENFTSYVKADYQNRNIDGCQYVTKKDESESTEGWLELDRNIRSTYKTSAAAFDYAISKNRGSEYAWKVEAGVTYTKQDDEFILPNSVQNYENLTFDLGAKINFVLSQNFNRRLLVDVHGAYNSNLSGEYVYGGSNPDYITVTEMSQGVQNFYTSDYYRIGGSLTYSQQVKENARINMFGKLAFDYVGTSDYDYDKRTYLSVSLGCNF